MDVGDFEQIDGLISKTQLRISKAQLKVSLKRLAAAKKSGKDKRVSRWERKVEKWISKVTKWAEKEGVDADAELSSVPGYSEYKSQEPYLQASISKIDHERDGRSDLEHIEEMIQWIQEEDAEDGARSVDHLVEMVNCRAQVFIGMPMTPERREWGESRLTQIKKSAEAEAKSLLTENAFDYDKTISLAQKELVDAIESDFYEDAEYMSYILLYLRVLKSEKDIPGGWVRGDMNAIESFINEVALDEGTDAAMATAYELRSQFGSDHEHYASLGEIISKAETDDALIGIIIGRNIIGNKRLMRRLKKIVNDEQYSAVEAITDENRLVEYLRSIVTGLNARDEAQLQRVIGDIEKRLASADRRAASATRRTTRMEQWRQWRRRQLEKARTRQDARFQKGSSSNPSQGDEAMPMDMGNAIVPAEIMSLLETVHDHDTVGESIKAVTEHYQCCENCGKTAKRKCKGCSAVYYCNSECSNADWKFHKAECNAIKEGAKWSELEGTEAMNSENPQSILMRQLTRHPLQVEFEIVDAPFEEEVEEVGLPELEDFDAEGVPELEYVGIDFDPDLEYVGARGRGGARGGPRGGVRGGVVRGGPFRGGRRRMPGYGRRYLRYGPRSFRPGRYRGFGGRGYWGRGLGYSYRPWGLVSALALAGLAAGIGAVNPYYYWYYPQYRAAVLNMYPGYVLPSSFVPPGGVPYSGWYAPPGYAY